MPVRNVVIVLADDLGWGDLSCYGATRIDTPEIDRLAADGVRATDAHASSAVCTPSRYGIMTGRYSWRGPLKRGVLGPHGPAIIEPGRPTLASILRAAGHATGAFGKWHLGLDWVHRDGSTPDARSIGTELVWYPDGRVPEPEVDYREPFRNGPLSLGFDTFFGTAGSLDMPPYCFLQDDRVADEPTVPKQLLGNQRAGLATSDWSDENVDVEVTRRAVEWMRSVAHQPFFCYLATSAPHRPYAPPAHTRGRSGAGVRGDCVLVVDWVVGQVRRCLEELGMLDDTLLVVTSDNGADVRFPEHGHPDHHPNGDWRGQKADLWEGGHRAPLVFHWPGGVPAATRFEGLASLTDILPTVVSAVGCGLPPGAAEDGRDLLPLLRGEAQVDPGRIVVHHSDDGSFALRRGSVKALFSTGSGGFSEPAGEPSPAFPPRVYDLAVDPREQTNLAGADPALEAQLTHYLMNRGNA